MPAHRTARLVIVLLLVLTFRLLQPSASVAQPVVDPRMVEFTASADHQDLVLRYDLEVYPIQAADPIAVLNLGRPAPGGDGMIRVDVSNAINGRALPAGEYVARVTAVGQAGSGRSEPSNSFTFGAGGCTYRLSATEQTYGAAGGPGSVAMTASANCAWTATSSVTWITILGGGGSGNGTVNFMLSTNTGNGPRHGNVLAGGQTLRVTQTGSNCNYSVSPSTQTFGANGGSGSVAVTAGGNCAWAASSSVNWITVTTTSGTGHGSVSYTVSPNGGAARTGTLSVAGQVVTITQSQGGGNPGGCSFTVSPTQAAFGPSGGSGSVAISASSVTTSTCNWDATSSVGWITISSMSGGVGGAGMITYFVSANPSPGTRTGTMTIAAQTFVVTQGPAGQGVCTFELSSYGQKLHAQGGQIGVSVTANGPGNSCSWTVANPTGWISVNPSEHRGSGQVNLAISFNGTGAARSAMLTIAGQPFVIHQDP